MARALLLAAAVLFAACGSADTETATVTPVPEATEEIIPDPSPTPTWTAEPTLLGPPLVHPSMHEEAVRLSEEIVERYGEVWPWIKDAWTWSTLRVYDAKGNALQCGGQMASGCIAGSTIHALVDGIIANDDDCCIEWAESLIGMLAGIWDFEMIRLTWGPPREGLEYSWAGTDRQRDWLHLRSEWDSYYAGCSEDELQFDPYARLQHAISEMVTTNRLYRDHGFQGIIGCSHEGLEYYELFDSQPYKLFEEMARLLINCNVDLTRALHPDRIEPFNAEWRNRERQAWSEEIRVRNWADMQLEFC